MSAMEYCATCGDGITTRGETFTLPEGATSERIGGRLVSYCADCSE